MKLSATKLTKITARILPLSHQQIHDIQSFVSRHEKFSGCYFWNPPTHASSRRQMERDNQMTLDFDHAGKHYHAEQSVDCSCKNVYYRATITVNDKKSTIRTLKNLLPKGGTE